MIKTMFNGGINGSWDFMVMSAQDAEEFIREPHNRRIAFISITEAHGYHIDFDKSYDKINFLPLKFDDCTTDIEGTCITDIQADNIGGLFMGAAISTCAFLLLAYEWNSKFLVALAFIIALTGACTNFNINYK